MFDSEPTNLATVSATRELVTESATATVALVRERRVLRRLIARLHRAQSVLANQLVSTYERDNPDLFAASWAWLVNREIFMTPGDEEQWTISVQHSEEDIRTYVEAFGEFCAELTR